MVEIIDVLIFLGIFLSLWIAQMIYFHYKRRRIFAERKGDVE